MSFLDVMVVMWALINALAFAGLIWSMVHDYRDAPFDRDEWKVAIGFSALIGSDALLFAAVRFS